MFFGWRTLNIDKNGYPCENYTGYTASCFVLFFWVIYIGEVNWNED